MNPEQEKWALFWCQLLRPIIFGDIEPDGEHAFLSTLTKTAVPFPDGRTRAPSLSTLKRKLKKFRHGGFDALQRAGRRDRGCARSVDAQVIAAAIEYKKDQPFRSDRVINFMLQKRFGAALPKTTLYRHLKQAGATRLKLGVCNTKVRKRFSRDHTHDLWVGDFADGPYVRVDNQVVPTYLCAYIDCHSRFAVQAHYYRRQNLNVLADSLVRALSTHGAPRGLYLDNAKIYISQGLRAACYRCNIRLMHRPVGDPAPGGIIERLIQTVQNQFETEVRSADMFTLDQLNCALAAWLAQAYHQQMHSDTSQQPETRYRDGLIGIRHVDTNSVIQAFCQRAQRTVNRTFSDVQLNRQYFKVDPKFRGDRVIVSFDPFKDNDTVQIYCLDNQLLCTAYRHDRKSAPPHLAQPKSKPKHSFLDLLLNQHHQQIDNRAAGGIDYRQSTQRWPFQAFVNAWAKLANIGLSDFTNEQLQMLDQFYRHNRWITRDKLNRAFKSAPDTSVAALIAYLLQQNKKES